MVGAGALAGTSILTWPDEPLKIGIAAERRELGCSVCEPSQRFTIALRDCERRECYCLTAPAKRGRYSRSRSEIGALSVWRIRVSERLQPLHLPLRSSGVSSQGQCDSVHPGDALMRRVPCTEASHQGKSYAVQSQYSSVAEELELVGAIKVVGSCGR